MPVKRRVIAKDTFIKLNNGRIYNQTALVQESTTLTKTNMKKRGNIEHTKSS